MSLQSVSDIPRFTRIKKSCPDVNMLTAIICRTLLGSDGQPAIANSFNNYIFLDLMLREGATILEHSNTFSLRWLAPPAQDIASYALVCLLRAAEVDVCGYKDVDYLDTGGRVLDIDTAGGGRAVVMEGSVLLLILKACAMFQDHDEVVKACCMLMRVGVQCSLSGGEPKVRHVGVFLFIFSTAPFKSEH